MKNADTPASPAETVDKDVLKTLQAARESGAEISLQDIRRLATMHGGLTKREYFAGLAMQALLSNSQSIINVPILAIQAADNLLKELDK